MSNEVNLRTFLLYILGIIVFLGFTSVAFVQYGFGRFQESIQLEGDARLLSNSVNGALSNFRAARSLSNQFLIASSGIDQADKAVLKYLPEFNVSVEDAILDITKAKVFALENNRLKKIFSILQTRLSHYQKSFTGIARLIKKLIQLRKETQQLYTNLAHQLESLDNRRQQALIILALKAKVLQEKPNTNEREFLTIVDRLAKKIRAQDFPQPITDSLANDLHQYRQAAIHLFKARNSSTAGITRYRKIELRIDRTLEKSQYDTQRSTDSLFEEQPSTVKWIPSAVTGASLSMALIVGLLVWIVTLRFSQGTQRLFDGVQKVAQGILDQPIALDRNDELGALATAFNKMSHDILSTNNTLFRTQEELIQAVQLAESKAEQLKEKNLEIEENTAELVKMSRIVGRADIATSTLHNAGNILNSLMSTAHTMSNRIRSINTEDQRKLHEALKSKGDELAEYLSQTDKKDLLLKLLDKNNVFITATKSELELNTRRLQDHIQHLARVIATQQKHAKLSSFKEEIATDDLLESALDISGLTSNTLHIRINKNFKDVPPLYSDKDKILQILTNLMVNAKNSIQESKNKAAGMIDIDISYTTNKMGIVISDNGHGVKSEIESKLFTLGFTTRPEGHGFGLHNCALLAKELGGQLVFRNKGEDIGASFELVLPLLNSIGFHNER